MFHNAEDKVTAVSYYQPSENSSMMADETKYKLIYFPAKYRGEIIRYVFAAASVPYEEEIVPLEDWFEGGRKEKTRPFKCLPMLEVDGGKLVLSQHLAIIRYLAKKFGLGGNDELEMLKADMHVEGANDVNKAIAPIIGATFQQDEPKIKEETEKFVGEKFKPWLTRCEAFLEANRANSGWLVGENMTYADLYVGELMFRTRQMHPSSMDDHPKALEFAARIHAIPAIEERIQNRPDMAY